MTFDIVYFFFALFACITIAYIVTMLWFTNARTRQLRSFVLFGVGALTWIFFSAVSAIVNQEYFVLMFTLHAITTAIFPFVFLWYVLNLSNSKLVNSKLFVFFLVAIPALDATMYATNPLHHLMLLTYDYPDLLMGPLFWVHAIFAYIATLAAMVAILVFVIRLKQKTPIMVLASLSIFVPLIINIMLALDLLPSRNDFTSIAFFITFTLFFFATYRSAPFTFKSVALTNIFTSLSDIIMIANARGEIVDSNTAFSKMFSSFPLTIGKTTVKEFTSWLSDNALDCQPENLLTDVVDTQKTLDENGELSILASKCAPFSKEATEEDGIITFTLRRDLIQSKNKVSGYLITMSDVSAYRAMISEINLQNERLVELKELAEQASVAKSSFLANMSHEIRTPINAVTGMATIARNTDDLERIHDCLGKIEAASRQLLGLINDILDFSKIEAGKLTLSSETFDLPASLLNIKNIIEITAAAKKLHLEFSIPDTIPRAVVGDDMRLSQIFLNLLSNAVKFTPENGNIAVTAQLLETRDTTHMLEVKVIDNGIGMSDDQQKKVFNSFEQADSSISKQYGGSGLGLVISRSLAELMGGGITLESTLGKGSCFTVRFNLEASSEDLATEDEIELVYDFTGKTALLAEDNVINQEIILTLLESSNIRVECAENGQLALDSYLANPEGYDLILMDIQMPVMDGLAATRAIRASAAPNAKTIPILAMTANAFAEDVDKCKEAGMDDHIAKPIEFDLLFKKMNRLLVR